MRLGGVGRDVVGRAHVAEDNRGMPEFVFSMLEYGVDLGFDDIAC